MSLKPKAKELLLRVREAILKEPARIRMANWRLTKRDQYLLVMHNDHAAIPPCGTVGCIAGWLVELHYKHPHSVVTVQYAASKLIGWRDKIGIDCPLFFTSDWPEDLKDKEYDLYTSGTPEYAAVVAAAIDRWIEADGDPERFRAS